MAILDPRKIALITGATAGIGKASAEILAQHNFNLIITGRRQERLNQLKQDLENKYAIKCTVLCFDIRHQPETEQAFNTLDETWKNIDVLVNNAGLAAGVAPIDEGNLDDWETMIDTNVKGLLYISRLVIPIMKQRKSGHIINIGSIAGKEVYKNGNIYCATKHAVDALTKAMRIDLVPYSIKVTGICPGATETEFSLVRHKGDKDKAKNVYNGFTPLVAEDIAEIIWFVLSRPAHVCLNDIVVTPTAQANVGNVYKTN